MNSLLFTFDGKNLKEKINRNNIEQIQNKLPQSQQGIRAFRTKKLKKRYENSTNNYQLIMQKLDVDKSTTLSPNVASQNIIKLSNFDPPVLSSQTIEDKPRNILQPPLISMKSDRLSLKQQSSRQKVNRNQNTTQIRKKRSVSLKDKPLVDYFKCKNKLPEAFRLQTIQQHIQSPQNRKNGFENSKQMGSSQRIKEKIVRKISGCRISPIIANFLKGESTKNKKQITKKQTNNEQQQRQMLSTPVFNRKQF